MPESSSSPLLTVRAADVASPETLLGAAGGEVAAVGVPTFRVDGDAAGASGVPGVLRLGATELSLALPDAVAQRRGFTGAAGQTLVATGAGGPVVVFLGCGDAG